MKRLLISLFVLGLLLLEARSLVAQPRAHSIDSLKVLLKQSRPDTNRANLLMEMAISYVLKPGEQATDLDTALLLVRQGYSISRYLHFAKGEGHAYLIGAQAYREKGNILQARRFGQTAINRFAKNNYGAQLAAAYMELGNTYSYEGEELKPKIKYYELALPLFHQAGLPEREATTLQMLADLYHIQQHTSKAIDMLAKALAIYKQINYPNLQGIYDLLGALYSSNGDYRMGTKYGLLALKTAEKQNDTTLQLCTIYNRLGVNYEGALDYNQAIQCFLRSLAVAKQYNDLPSIGIVGTNLGSTYFKTGQYDLAVAFLTKLLKDYPALDLYVRLKINSQFLKIYQKKKQYKLAQKYYDQLIDQIGQIKRAYPEYLSIILAYPPIIDFLLSTHQLEKAKPIIKEHFENSKRMGIKKLIANSYLMLSQLDSAQGNYLTALRNLQTYHFIQDSLLSENKNKELARLNIEFQTEKKEQVLQLREKDIQVLTNRNLAQQANLRQKDLQRNSMIVGAILLILLLGLTYNRYRLKQRSNQLLEAKQRLIDQKNRSLQQVLGEKENILKDKDILLIEKEQLLEEREWMLKEIHHRVKNNLQVISSMLNSQFNFLQDPSALAAIRESQNRVQVMALIHQKLYQSDNLAQINMKEYIHEIVDYLIESFDRFNTVHSQLDIADVYFDVALATPLGLIINEAVTNSLKYAFPNNQTGRLRVSLSCEEGPAYQLTIADDGIGLPAGFDVTRSKTLGMTMIRGLSKQIKAKLDITQDTGIMIALRFNLTEKKARPVLSSVNGAD